MMEAVIDLSTSPLMGRRQPPRTMKSLKPLDETQESSIHHDTPCSNGTAEDGSKSVNEEPSLPKRNLRKRRAESTVTLDPIEAMKPLTDEERRNWKGWVELESDPALFNYVLRSYGVKDVKVQEVFSLDLLYDLPKPVYGLIFLFKYRDDDAEEVEGVPKCPKHVWFANQTIDNACATIALLNIVMNVPDIDLGDALNSFKEETKKLKPPYRGQRLGYNEFIRSIHNSFARRMDILNADLALQNEFDKWKKSKTNQKRKILKGGSAKKRKKPKDEEEPGYHFIAYVPINDVVWRLDGLQRQPINIGACEEDWTAIARDNIFQRIEQYEGDGIEYSLMSLCKSPLRSIQENLAQSMHSISAVEKALSALVPDWKLFMDADESISVTDLNESLGLPQDLINNATPSVSAIRRLEEVANDPGMLMSYRKTLMGEQSKLRAAYLQEVAEISQEDEQAERRKHDYTPTVYNSIKSLAEAGVLKDIVMDTRGN